MELEYVAVPLAQPCKKYCKAGCVSCVTSELTLGLLVGSVWWVWQAPGIHPQMQYEECGDLCSGTSYSLLTEDMKKWG